MNDALRCPRDESTLERHVAGPSELHRCPRCHGIWIRGADLGALLDGRTQSWRLPDLLGASRVNGGVDRPVQCRCPGAPLMQEIRRGKVLIDLCGECSAIWLDGGELDALMVQEKFEIKDGVISGRKDESAGWAVSTVLDVISWVFL